MIEPILRKLLAKQTLRQLVNPRLERFRARVPYFVVVGLVTCTLLIPVISILLLAQLLGYKGTEEMSLRRSWLTVLACPVGVMLLFAVLAVVQRISGFRSFSFSFGEISAADRPGIALRIKEAAREHGFMAAWESSDGENFVAVRDVALELSRFFNTGKRFPMRLSLFTTGGELAMKITNRTVILWDTGERITCEQIGRSILAAAAQEPGGSNETP